MHQNFDFLVGLTTGRYSSVITSLTESFEDSRTSASLALASVSGSLTYDQMYSTDVRTFWVAQLTASVTNYVIKAARTDEAALSSAYVLSASFLS